MRLPGKSSRILYFLKKVACKSMFDNSNNNNTDNNIQFHSKKGETSKEKSNQTEGSLSSYARTLTKIEMIPVF